MAGTRLSQLVTVRGRFHRSVSLTRDWRGARDFSEYIVTPSVRAIAEQVLDELRREGGVRAWSLTGPYGTGKSAFALFLADVLASGRPAHDVGRALRGEYFPGTKRMVPILVQAERGPLLPAVLEALAGELTAVSRPLAAVARGMLKKAEISGEAVADLLVEAAEKAAGKGLGGIALIVDELGKFLEVAASDPKQGDVFVLQQLAEAAARSEVPILFTTILHTGFADYLAHGDEVRRAEWQKVQGRFRDVPFQLPSEQLLALVGHALETKFRNGIDRAYRRQIDSFLEAKELRPAIVRGGLGDLLTACLPLHPLTALALWPLFRSKVAQNERSLFAFLTSHEPHGFQEFLLRSEASSRLAPLYGLPELYDYVAASLGLAAFSGSDSRRWALVDHGLHRIPASAPPVAHDIVKSIGLLAQYGLAAGLRPSRALLERILGDRPQFSDALSLLEEESIVVYRRHSDSYSLWEGSDLNLDEVFAEARSRLSRDPLPERLGRALDLPPAVARAHYIKTGTLRFFEPQITSAHPVRVKEALRKPTQADGRILFLFDSGEHPARRGQELSRMLPAETIALVAVPRVGHELFDALDEWECWRWVRDHVTELEGDPVARQEVQARLEAARQNLERVAGGVFGLRGHVLDPSSSDWFFRGRPRKLKSPRDFQGLLSSTCEEVFQQAPRLHNELLNRHNLSSAAARARRNLLERMVESQHLPNLGITGFPPEFSMYKAMLGEGGFHGGRGRSQGLRAPTREAWKPVWGAIEGFLEGAVASRRPVADLIAILKSPPFGLRDGPIPVLLGVALVVKGHELALYEDSVFVPEVSIEVLERLTRRPETFEIQSYRLSEEERRVLAALARLIRADAGDDALLAVVKALVRLAASLPPYAKQTKRLDVRTRQVRDLLLNATDPKALLFAELPNALGIHLDRKRAADEYGRALRRCTTELSHAYLGLLDSIEESICTSFGIAKRGAEARALLRERAARLVPFASDPSLQVFVREAAREDARDWREVLGRAASDGKPPSYWRDEDAAGLRVKLQGLVGEFDRLEELVAASDAAPSARIVSIGVLENGISERRAVVSCPAEEGDRVAELTDLLRTALHQNGPVDDRMKLVAAAEIIREIYSQLHGEKVDG